MFNVYCPIRSLSGCHLEDHPTSVRPEVPRGSNAVFGAFIIIIFNHSAISWAEVVISSFSGAWRTFVHTDTATLLVTYLQHSGQASD